MKDTFFTQHYPDAVPKSLDFSLYSTVVEVFDRNAKTYAERPAFTALGTTLTYAELDKLSQQFAAYLQNHTRLKAGDRLAIQLPNLLQYPVVLFGAMRAGIIVVNTNPLYTQGEMLHQFNDSGAKAVVILANMAHKLKKIIAETELEEIIITEVGDLCSLPKRIVVNVLVKYVHRAVPAYYLPKAKLLNQVLALGAKAAFMPSAKIYREDICVLQYTGGTTGISKGAMLTHGNLVANMLQARPYFEMCLGKSEPGEPAKTVIAPLPLYHIYAFTVHCMILMETGNHSVLIPNPRDLKAFVKELRQWQFDCFLGLNTLFVALCKNHDFCTKVDFSRLKLTVSGGMALTRTAAELWQKVTGCEVTEGYGMTETSPIACFNPPGFVQLGTIGLPVPGTLCKVIDEQGQELGIDQAGELCIKGPQVMKGYWQCLEATDQVLDHEGWLKTGDIGVIQADGYLRIVDRKKDMIIVSGFNVYPNEVEEVMVSHPGIIECAMVGIPDEYSGEVVKLFVVKTDANLNETAVRAFAKEHLTAYKIPKLIEFRDELPKSNVGKVLRRKLREETSG